MPSFERHVFVCINERPADHPKGCCKAKGGIGVPHLGDNRTFPTLDTKGDKQ